jgi:cell division protein FtsI (penicillin-binding protein 3)
MFNNHEKPRGRIATGLAVGTLATILTIALAFGAEKTIRDNSLPNPNPGFAAVDPAIQEIAENALKQALKSESAKAGFAIVADPLSGRILAIANIDTVKNRTGHWSLGQLMEPASILKTLVAAQAIDSGLTTPHESHACENGSYSYGGHVFHDWKKVGWDHMTTEDTIAFSGDICAMKIGEKIGAAGLRHMLVNFGFGPDGSASLFPEARSGVLPPPDGKQDSDIVPFVSMGYGFRTTPLEVIQAYGAIANGGTLLEPAPVSDPGQHVIRRVLSQQSAEQMKAILEQVVLKGTARGRAASDLYTTAGKTASSFVPDLTREEQFDGRNKGNFAGFVWFAPVKSPRVEIYVGIRDPQSPDGAHGSAHAAPVFKQIAEDVLKQMKVAPDKPQA